MVGSNFWASFIDYSLMSSCRIYPLGGGDNSQPPLNHNITPFTVKLNAFLQDIPGGGEEKPASVKSQYNAIYR